MAMVESLAKSFVYRKGLNMSVKEWASATLKQCKNQFSNRMDCATVNSLVLLSQGEVFDFVAFRYKMDNEEALTILTNDMGVETMSLGYSTVMKITTVKQACRSMYSVGSKIGVELIAFFADDIERVYFEPLGVEGKLLWTQDAVKLNEEILERQARKRQEKMCQFLLESDLKGEKLRKALTDLINSTELEFKVDLTKYRKKLESLSIRVLNKNWNEYCNMYGAWTMPNAMFILDMALFYQERINASSVSV